MTAPKKPVCVVCRRPCSEADRTVDGTYLCRECGYATSTRPGRKGDGDLYRPAA